MAIYLPIITELKSDGIDKAKKEFKSLEGAGAKAQYAIKKAAIPAAAALGGLAVALGDATKGAIEDAAAQSKLAGQLKRSTFATDDQVAATEEWISAQGSLRAVTDSELRPAIARLASTTGSLEMAQEGVTLAMDIAAATGKPLQSVTEALAKAYGGNLTAIQKLDPGMRDLIKSGADVDQVMAALNQQFGGAAVEAANTAEGGMKKLSIAMDETKESIGAALLPILEKLMPYLLKFADWAQKNPTVIMVIAGAIGVLAASILAVNAAMALNPVTLIVAGIIALGVAVVAAYKKFETFRNVVKTVVNGVLTYLEFVANGWIKVANVIIRGMNLLKPGKDIPSISPISLGRMGDDSSSSGNRSAVPMLADGGIVTGPTLAVIGEAGPEAVVPLDRLGQMGGGGGITINVNGGDPNAVVDALRKYFRQNGPLPIGVAY